MIITGILLMASLVLAGPQNAQADTWAIATIDSVGQQFGTSIVTLSQYGVATPTFTNKIFKLNATVSKPMLAVALTALSIDSKVTVAIATDGETINVIKTKK